MTSFHIETYGGCLYSADSEYMAGLLQQAKFEHQEKLEEADIVIFNTGTADSSSIDSFWARLNTVRREHPYKMIVAAGGIPQAEPERFKNFTLVGTRQFHHIAEAVEETLHNNIVKMLDMSEMPPLNLPKIRKNPFLEIIPITRGSIRAAASPKIKQIQKSMDSYPPADIVTVAANAVKEGVKEIRLTAPDAANYGATIGTNLPDLLKELIAIPGEFKIRLDSCNPENLQKIKESLFPLFAGEKMFKFIHIPLLSGSNAVLKQTGVEFTKEECTSLVQELWQAEPHITLAIDVEVGHPAETEDDFWETLNLVRFLNPDVITISPFWARPKTPAASLPPLPEEEIKRRVLVLTDIYQNISTLRNERWKGWEGIIIIDEKGAQPKEWIGHNEYYKPVIVEGEYQLGDTVKIKIMKTGRWGLRGERI